MKISGFENIISIIRFEYLGEVNQHERCSFACDVKERDIDSLMGKVDSDCTFKDDVFEFKGHITDIAVTRDISGVLLEACAVGSTWVFDQERHWRVFQDREKKLSDVIKVLSSMKKVPNRVTNECEIPGILVQDGITDWSFAVNLATLAGEFVFPGESTFISNKGDAQGELKDEELISSRFTVTLEGALLFCRIRRNLALGDVVTYKGRQLMVFRKRYFKEHCSYHFEYLLKETKEPNDSVMIANSAVFEAEVLNNSDDEHMGRIQVSFTKKDDGIEIEDPMQDNAAWLPVESFFATKDHGAVFIPAKGDKVIVRIFNGYGTVSGELRTEQFNQIIKDPKNQSVMLDKTTYIKCDNESNGKNKSIIIQKGKNKLEMFDEKLDFHSDKQVCISIDTKSLNISVSKSQAKLADDLEVKTGDMTVNAGGAFSVDSKSNVNIKGRSGVSLN